MANRSSGQLLLDLLGDRPIAYHPRLARAFESVNVAVFLGQLLYWTGREADPAGWVWKSRAAWTEETALSAREQRQARQVLREAGILAELQRGYDRTLGYRVDRAKLLEVLAIGPNVPMHGAETTNGTEQNVSMHGDETAPCMETKRPHHDHRVPESTAESTAESAPPARAPALAPEAVPPAPDPAAVIIPPAVKFYHVRMFLWPARQQSDATGQVHDWWAEMADIVGFAAVDLDLWGDVLDWWREKLYNPLNVAGMLNRFQIAQACRDRPRAITPWELLESLCGALRPGPEPPNLRPYCQLPAEHSGPHEGNCRGEIITWEETHG